jgi:predicted small metal-binding protein
VGEDNILPTF